MDVKKNTCCHCQTLFTPAFRHPHQKCCGKKKCVLAGRAKLQKKKMDEDLHYRQNQKESNQTWLENNPDYWKEYRKRNPDKAMKNRLMQQIRNQKRFKIKPPAVKVNLDELVAKMSLVKSAEPKQQISLWLLSTTAEMAPIKVFLISKTDSYSYQPDNRSQSIRVEDQKTKDSKERI